VWAPAWRLTAAFPKAVTPRSDDCFIYCASGRRGDGAAAAASDWTARLVTLRLDSAPLGPTPVSVQVESGAAVPLSSAPPVPAPPPSSAEPWQARRFSRSSPLNAAPPRHDARRCARHAGAG